MPDGDVPKPESSRQSRQFRFGLKTLFVVITCLCMWFGGRLARERRVKELISRRQAIVDSLTARIVIPPADTFYDVFNPGSADDIAKQLAWPGRSFLRARILESGHTASISSETLMIDVSQLLKSKPAAAISEQLVQYYAGLLPANGLTQSSMDNGTSSSSDGKDVGRTRCVWNSANSDLNVIIDAEVYSTSQKADVRILFIDAQQLHLW